MSVAAAKPKQVRSLRSLDDLLRQEKWAMNAPLALVHRDVLGARSTLILFELGDFPMMREMLLGVKARAETRPAER
jgi:hypothetical protein